MPYVIAAIVIVVVGLVVGVGVPLVVSEGDTPTPISASAEPGQDAKTPGVDTEYLEFDPVPLIKVDPERASEYDPANANDWDMAAPLEDAAGDATGSDLPGEVGAAAQDDSEGLVGGLPR